MEKSIFELENRLSIEIEFKKFIKVFHEMNIVSIGSYPRERTISLFNYFDVAIFKDWKYRDTMLSTSEFLENIGINKDILVLAQPVSEEKFLMYIEFVLNMINKCNHSICRTDSILNATLKNIPLILEKMNYNSKEVEDRIIIVKRDADVDSVLEEVSAEISMLLLEYNDFRINDDIKEKRRILKQIDLYIEKNIKIKNFDKGLDDAIGTIVNNMGVNHPINEEPYSKMSDAQLIEWYDKCFLMMIHAIRSVKVNEIKNERKELIK